MDFSWPKEYLEYRAQVEDFIRAEVNPTLAGLDESQTFPREAWEACARFGMQSLPAPASLGGPLEEVDFSRALLAMQGFGYACTDNGLPFAMNAQMWTVQTPLLEFGSPEQHQKFLVPMMRGEMIGAHALTERQAGSDVMSLQLKATKVDGGYLLNGDKWLITLGPICDVALVIANTRPELGKWGISAFIVERGMKGFEQSKKMSKMGMRCIPIGGFTFTDCFVPEENLVGSEGSGFGILHHSLEYDRCSIMAAQLGAMERQLEESITYVKGREQFGQPVGKFQSVSNRIAEMKLRLETARLLLYKTAWLKEQGKSAAMEAALLKLQLSEAFVDSSLDAIRNYGGIGFLSETGADKNLRDAVGGLIYAGTSDIQRNIIAKLLGL